MLAIRFFRVGKKGHPSFRIVVTDKRRAPRAGRFVEEVGFYNPLTKEKSLNQERIKYWLSVGAKTSDSVHNLLVKEKIVQEKKIPVHKKSAIAAKPPLPALGQPRLRQGFGGQAKEAKTLQTEPLVKKEEEVALPLARAVEENEAVKLEKEQAKQEEKSPEAPEAPESPKADLEKSQ